MARQLRARAALAEESLIASTQAGQLTAFYTALGYTVLPSSMGNHTRVHISGHITKHNKT